MRESESVYAKILTTFPWWKIAQKAQQPGFKGFLEGQGGQIATLQKISSKLDNAKMNFEAQSRLLDTPKFNFWTNYQN